MIFFFLFQVNNPNFRCWCFNWNITLLVLTISLEIRWTLCDVKILKFKLKKQIKKKWFKGIRERRKNLYQTCFFLYILFYAQICALWIEFIRICIPRTSIQHFSRDSNNLSVFIWILSFCHVENINTVIRCQWCALSVE